MQHFLKRFILSGILLSGVCLIGLESNEARAAPFEFVGTGHVSLVEPGLFSHFNLGDPITVRLVTDPVGTVDIQPSPNFATYRFGGGTHISVDIGPLTNPTYRAEFMSGSVHISNSADLPYDTSWSAEPSFVSTPVPVFNLDILVVTTSSPPSTPGPINDGLFRETTLFNAATAPDATIRGALEFFNNPNSHADVFFDLHEFATGPVGAPIPEPSTVMLMGSGLLGLLNRMAMEKEQDCTVTNNAL